MKKTVLLGWLALVAGVATSSATPTRRVKPKRATSPAHALATFPAAASIQPRASIGPMPDAPRTSASYALAAETFDAGGAAVATSASGTYTLKDTSVGNVGALTASAAYTAKGGYAGQLYEVQGLAVTSPTPNVNEGSSLQLGAAPLLDDGTLLAALAPAALSWAVVSGPLASISSTGVATASTVYQNTPATVQASSGNLRGTGTFTVLNINLDNYGAYAGDGIDDAWQVRYFGLNNPQAAPNVDADGTGQTNLFKYMAGLNPLDPNSRFALAIAKVAGQPTRRTLTFSPVYSGHTYTVQYTPTLTQPNWTTLTGATVNVNGTIETVTDPNATTSPRFYRVQVSYP